MRTTRVAKATSKSDSLRTTIPKELADVLDLKPHDYLVWTPDLKSKEITLRKFGA